MGRFVHVGTLARAKAHRWRASAAVLAGLVLLAGTGCSTAPIWMGSDSSIGASPAPGSPNAVGPGVGTAQGGGHGGKTGGSTAGSTGGSGTGPRGSSGNDPGGPSSTTPGGPSGTGRAVLFGG
jgi:hypothetical protein